MALPRWYELARGELGVKEKPGRADNPVIQAFYRDAGHPEVKHDSVPWCAAFVGAMLERAGVKPSGSLAARSYLAWGRKIDHPVPGCVVVFSRGHSRWEGHVAFFVRDLAGNRIEVLGGNQSDRVSLEAFPKSRVLGYRLPAAQAA